MKKISKIVVFIISTTVTVFLSSMSVTAGSWTMSSNWDGDKYHVVTNGDVCLGQTTQDSPSQPTNLLYGTGKWGWENTTDDNWSTYNAVARSSRGQSEVFELWFPIGTYVSLSPYLVNKFKYKLLVDRGTLVDSPTFERANSLTGPWTVVCNVTADGTARTATFPSCNYAYYRVRMKIKSAYEYIDYWTSSFRVYEVQLFEAGYWSSGYYISPSKDTASNSTVWGRLFWSATLNDQTLKFRIATNNGNATWSFLGPDGSASSYYTDSGQKIWPGHDGDRYIKVRAYFWGTVDKTPVLHSFTVNYNCRPTIPVLSSPTDSSTLDDSRPTLTWINSIDRDGDTLTYKILVDNNSDFYSPEAIGSNIQQGPSTTSYISPALVDDTYYWRVCANDGALNSDWSATWSFTLDTKSPEVVSIYPPDDGQLVAEEVDHITVDFSEDIDETTITSESICLSDEYGTDILLQGRVIYASSITLSVPQLEYCREYNIFISRNIKDTIGHSLVRDYNFSFITLIPEERIAPVTVEHKTDGVIDRVWIDNPARTFPEGSKRCYIKLIETEISSLSKYVEGTGRKLKCYKVDDNGTQEDINQLDNPVTISIPYPSDTKDKENLEIYLHNEDRNRWELVKGSGDTNPDDDDYSVTGEVSITNTKYCVRGFAMGGLIERYSNYPNPFKAGKEKTTIEYYLEKDAKVTISIYDLLGQLVRRIEIPKAREGGSEGRNEVFWYGKNERGRVVANGGYYCVVEADTETGKHMKKVRKIMVIK